jgi:hypothetical protein
MVPDVSKARSVLIFKVKQFKIKKLTDPKDKCTAILRNILTAIPNDRAHARSREDFDVSSYIKTKQTQLPPSFAKLCTVSFEGTRH